MCATFLINVFLLLVFLEDIHFCAYAYAVYVIKYWKFLENIAYIKTLSERTSNVLAM